MAVLARAEQFRPGAMVIVAQEPFMSIAIARRQTTCPPTDAANAAFGTQPHAVTINLGRYAGYRTISFKIADAMKLD
mgnify:CR=1 FL=1